VRRSLPLLLALLVLQAVPSAAQCNFPPVYSEQFRSTALDLAIDGNDLWVATSYGLTLYDRSVDPPAGIASIALPGPTNRVRARGGIAYAGSGDSVFVVRRSGRYLARTGSLGLGATIYDLLLHEALNGAFLYAGTSAGLKQIDLFVADSPVLARSLVTSSGVAFSLARIGTTLYAADGDNTVEVFSIDIPSLPQRLGGLETLPRASLLSTDGLRLFVSDGLRTETFAGAPLAFKGRSDTIAVSSLHPLPAGSAFVGGLDRTLRAVDLSSPSNPAILFESSVPISAGTVNRVTALAGTQNRLYVAAGDAGLLTFDTTSFTIPSAVRTSLVTASASLLSRGTSVIVAGLEGGLEEYALTSGGFLTRQRDWDSGRESAVWDVNVERLLATSGSSFTIWDLAVTPPRAVTSGTFSAAIRQAILGSDAVYAVLSDRTLWRGNAGSGAVEKVSIQGSPSFIVRSRSAIALADITDAGTTTIRYFQDGDVTAAPKVVTLEGAASRGIAISPNGIVAAATFRGIHVVDFSGATPSVRIAQRTDASSILALRVNRSEVIILTSEVFETISLQSLQTTRRVRLPGENLALHYDSESDNGIAVVGGTAGITTVLLSSASRAPELVPAFQSNAFYRTITGSDQVVALFDGRQIATMPLRQDGFPDPGSRMTGAAAVGVAVAGSTVFGLSSSGRLTAYDARGTTLSDYQIEEGSDAVFLGINTVGGAVWVSLSRGCLAGQCELKTIVLDPRGPSLVPTATLSGSFVDGVVTGTRAYVLAVLPPDAIEIRTIDLTDPFHPVIVASRAAEGKPVSIAHSPLRQTLYTLGDRVYGYDESSLSRAAELLDSYVPEPTGRVTYNDQRLRILDDCALIIGRTFSPQLFTITSASSWSSVSTPPAAAAFRSIFTRSGFFYLLSDYSFEIWSSVPRIVPRRRPARL